MKRAVVVFELAGLGYQSLLPIAGPPAGASWSSGTEQVGAPAAPGLEALEACPAASGRFGTTATIAAITGGPVPHYARQHVDRCATNRGR